MCLNYTVKENHTTTKCVNCLEKLGRWLRFKGPIYPFNGGGRWGGEIQRERFKRNLTGQQVQPMGNTQFWRRATLITVSGHRKKSDGEYTSCVPP